MQGLQKQKCTTCGVTFMSENESTKCPSCSSSQVGEKMGGGCGCGGHHH